MTNAEVRLDHCWVAPDFGRCPCSDHRSEVEHVHPVADIEHQAHVMVDQEQGRAIVDDVSQKYTKRLALLGVQTRRRLVEAHLFGSETLVPR